MEVMKPALPNRITLGRFPTPLHRLERLSEELGGVDLWVKRDDLSGLGFGGNKIRKLEFLMADALSMGCDCVITIGGAQSNHACQTAAAARFLGIEPVLVLARPLEERDPPTGNLLLEKIMAAGVRFVEVKGAGELHGKMEEVAGELRDSGRKPYTIPLGGSNGMGAVGYARAVEEIVEQGGEFDFVFTACGTGGTLAGLAVGRRALGGRFQAVGIDVGAVGEGLGERVAALARDTARTIGLDSGGEEDDFTIYDDYVGKGYGIPTEEGIEAIRLLSRKEGLFLDPVYTSKAVAGLIDLIRKGVIPRSSRVLFIHTGGSAALFAYGGYF